MIIAKQKRRENIAEYILYLWQLEDLLRALSFDAGKVYTTLIEPQKELTDEQKEMVLFWYIDMINLLKSEGKSEIGHLEHTEHLISELNDLHLRLLQSEIKDGDEYKKRYEAVNGELPKIKSHLKNPNISDIEACFRALYSVILLRLKGEKNSYINDTIELISPLIALLASVYKKAEEGETDLFENK